jgi:ferredoxin
MATSLYYFTGTGNSLQVAMRLGRRIEDSTLIPMIRDLDTERIIPDTDVVGFVFPQHASGLPRIVLNFMNKLSLPNSEYVFAVVTCMHPRGFSLDQLDQILVKKKRTLNAGFFIPMPVNYILGFDPPPLEAQHTIIGKAMEKLDEVVAIISRRDRHMDGDGFPMKILHRFTDIYRNRMRSLGSLDYNFTVTDGCDACGTCELVCPVGNITLINKVPTWHHRCEQCLSCINLCPSHVIEYGEETQGRNRYKNPNIQISEIIERNERRCVSENPDEHS